MVAHVSTTALVGLQAIPVTVQVQITPGQQVFSVVGLPSKAVKESSERVRGALHAMGVATPASRITFNLSPADLQKDGSHYDLPMALALLVAAGVIPAESMEGVVALGELGLDATLQPVPGCLPAALDAAARGARWCIVPQANAAEAAWAGQAGAMGVLGAATLPQLIRHLRSEDLIPPATPTAQAEETSGPAPDLRDIRGQEQAKRAAELAAAGGHHLLLSGPPGSGKSMLASRLPGLMPPLTAEEALETSMVWSVAGLLPHGGLIRQRPFRDPHHSASPVALTGGGLRAKPGEMSLCHRGVLFLDELPEFPRAVLETLRQPLETGNITIARANAHVSYPAKFMLVAAMNPCACGHAGDPAKGCKNQPACVLSYQNRLSGPLLDRFDLRITVPAVKPSDLSLPPAKEGTAEVAARVAAARTTQARRYAGTAIRTNAELQGAMLDEFCPLPAEARTLLNDAATKFGLTARGYHRVIRVARTIADVAALPHITRAHVAEALAYRGLSA